MNKPLLYAFILAFVGCSTEVKKSQNVFFAGEIINPTSEYVVLYKDEIVIDSAKLNDENKFSIELESVVEGLYHFDHHPELQYVYLEKGDSLLVRLNTNNFDETLIFSGRGKEINNFLLELFLSTEEEVPTIYSYARLDPIDFSNKIDSLRNIKTSTLNVLQKEAALSDNAIALAQASIDYNYYNYKEKYPFWHRRVSGKKSIPELDDDFYGYRESLDYNLDGLAYHRYYYNYLKSHIDNLAYMGCAKDCEGSHREIIGDKLHFNQHKLAVINDLVKTKNLRDNLFRSVAIYYLINIHDTTENIEAFIKDFQKYSSNNQHISEIEAVYEGVKNMQPNNKLPEVMVFDNGENLISLQEIAEKDKNVVFYFWSGTQEQHFKNIIRRVDELRSLHPEYTFIGINCNTEMKRWQAMLFTYDLDLDTQYRTDDFENLKYTLVIGGLNKGIITKNGRIVDAYADLYRSF
ncbi:MAG: transaldolase [Arenibacter sp.]|nr:transaldolase [Arenibacter sp.]